VGLAQVTTGMAWWYRKYAIEQSPEDQGLYESAEQEAKAKRSGLWQDKNPQPPWSSGRPTSKVIVTEVKKSLANGDTLQ